MPFLFGMSLRGFSSLPCSLVYIQSWGMLLERGSIYKLSFTIAALFLGETIGKIEKVEEKYFLIKRKAVCIFGFISILIVFRLVCVIHNTFLNFEIFYIWILFAEEKILFRFEVVKKVRFYRVLYCVKKKV